MSDFIGYVPPLSIPLANGNVIVRWQKAMLERRCPPALYYVLTKDEIECFNKGDLNYPACNFGHATLDEAMVNAGYPHALGVSVRKEFRIVVNQVPVVVHGPIVPVDQILHAISTASRDVFITYRGGPEEQPCGYVHNARAIAVADGMEFMATVNVSGRWPRWLLVDGRYVVERRYAQTGRLPVPPDYFVATKAEVEKLEDFGYLPVWPESNSSREVVLTNAGFPTVPS